MVALAQQEFLTIKDIQSILKVSKNIAYDLCKRADFPAMKIGGTYRVSADEFKKWCDRQAYKENK